MRNPYITTTYDVRPNWTAAQGDPNAFDTFALIQKTVILPVSDGGRRMHSQESATEVSVGTFRTNDAEKIIGAIVNWLAYAASGEAKRENDEVAAIEARRQELEG